MNRLQKPEEIAEAINITAEKIIKSKRYAPHNCEVVLSRGDMYLKYKKQRIGSFQFINGKVKYQHEIPHKV